MGLRKLSKKFFIKVNPTYRHLVNVARRNDSILEQQQKSNVELHMLKKRLREIEATIEQQGSDIVGSLEEVKRTMTKISDEIAGIKRLAQATTDIAALPRSYGALRDIQNISLDMLREVNRICSKYKLKYWLDFGTLLGAVRHRGFIPWDDDMDLGMMSADYEKFLSVIDNELESTDFRFIRVPSQIGKIVHKNFMPHGDEEITKFMHWDLQEKLCFALDIFPYYYAKETITDTQLQEQLTKVAKDKAGIFSSRHTYSNFSKHEKILRSFLKKTKSEKPTKRVFLGPETSVYQPHITPAEGILPLLELEFEGELFPVPGHYKELLISYYGDYMEFPKQTRTHLFLDSVSKEELKLLKKSQKPIDG